MELLGSDVGVEDEIKGDLGLSAVDTRAVDVVVRAFDHVEPVGEVGGFFEGEEYIGRIVAVAEGDLVTVHFGVHAGVVRGRGIESGGVVSVIGDAVHVVVIIGIQTRVEVCEDGECSFIGTEVDGGVLNAGVTSEIQGFGVGRVVPHIQSW